MGNNLNREIYIPVFNTLDLLFEFETIAIYSYDYFQFNILEVFNNDLNQSIPPRIDSQREVINTNYKNPLYMEEQGLYTYKHIIYSNIEEKEPIGLICFYSNTAISKNNFELLNKYIEYLQQELNIPILNYRVSLINIVDANNIIVEVKGEHSNLQYIQDLFLDKSVNDIFFGNNSIVIKKIFENIRIKKERYLLIYGMGQINKDVYFNSLIRPVEDDKIEMITSFFPAIKYNSEAIINFNMSEFTNYVMRLFNDKTQYKTLKNIKDFIQELGLINGVDSANISLFNSFYDNIFNYTWQGNNINHNYELEHGKIPQIIKGYNEHNSIISYPDKYENYKEYNFEIEELLNNGIKSFILIPFGKVNNLFGIIFMYSKEKLSWNPDQKNYLLILTKFLSSQLSTYYSENEKEIQRDRYDTLIEKSPDLVIRFDNNYKIMYINKTVERYNLNPRDVINKVIFDENISTNIYIDKYIDHLHHIQVTCQEYESSFITENKKMLRARIIPEINSEGSMESGMIILSDLTSYMNTAQEKLENEEKLKLAIEASNAVIWEININNGKLDFSGNINKLLKYNNHACIDIQTIIKPEYYMEIKRYIFHYIREVSVNKDLTINYEIKVKDANNKSIWLLIKGRITRWYNNKPVIIMGTAIDITTSKIREKEVKFLAEHDSLTGLYNRHYYEEILKSIDMKCNYPIGIIVIDVDGLKVINDAFGHQMGDNLIIVVGKALTNAFNKRKSIISRIGGDEFSVILNKTDLNELEYYSSQLNELLGKEKIVSITPSVSIGYAIKENVNENLSDYIFKLAEDMMYKRKLLKTNSTKSIIIKSLQEALQEKTHETKEHCKRIEALAIKVSKEMKLQDSVIDDIVLLSHLHDIGIIAIPDNIINKSGDLTREEWEIMRSHCEIGYRIASSTKEIYSISEGILSHHERWDGKGYPRGIKGEDIPLISRIISVIDAYDSMTNKRFFRKSIPTGIAIKEINKKSGSQFDPKIVKIFNKIMRGN